MKVLLYLRVSTDEQAEKGYSLRDQQAKLEKYCIDKGYEVVRHFQEDHSAKTFDRPRFKDLLEFVKQNKGLVQKVLVIKWDRFSRNMEHSLNMLTYLHKLGVEVEATEQPLDNSVPENLLMKAFYLAAPQVENHRRSLNTFNGMRKAMKEGRYVSSAPQGYLNSRDSRGKPILIIDEEKAPLIKEMFELMASGKYPQQHVRKMINQSGLYYCRTKFRTALQNPIYIGKIRIAAYKGEPEEIVPGIHPGIVDETTFYRVQDILSGRSLTRRPTLINKELPLRGYLYCTAAGHRLTGSCSHGRGGQYHYYHCPNTNCERHRADQVNESYVQLLERLKIDKETAEIYAESLAQMMEPDKSKQSSLQQQVSAQEQRIRVLQDKLIDGAITSTDYQQIKTRYESTLFDLRNQLSAILTSYSDFSANFGNSLNLLTNLPEYYQSAKTELKRELISSITPGKLYFENKEVRTSEINQAILMIATIDKGYNQSNVLRKVEYDSNVLSGSPSSTLVRTLSSDLQLLSALFKRVA